MSETMNRSKMLNALQVWKRRIVLNEYGQEDRKINSQKAALRLWIDASAVLLNIRVDCMI